LSTAKGNDNDDDDIHDDDDDDAIDAKKHECVPYRISIWCYAPLCRKQRQ
jgi:hypothetical protein